MSEDLESLRATIVQLELALKQERQRRQRAESLLRPLRSLLSIDSAQGLFDVLLGLGRQLFDADEIVILQREQALDWRAVASTLPLLFGQRWARDAFFEKVIEGKPIASFELSLIEAWAAQTEEILSVATSSLHVGLRADETELIFIALHKRRGFFNQEHIKLAKMLSLVIEQALESLQNRRLRRRQELLLREQELTREKFAVLKNAHDQALAASQAKSIFLANMSHELRTPLNAIIGYAELVMEDYGEEMDEAIADLNKIRSSALHLLALINDLLDLSKIEAGKMALQPELIPLDTFLQEIQESLSPLIERHHNILEIIAPWRQVALYTDRLKLRQILVNLLSNANKFTESGRLCLRVLRDPDGHGWRFEVEDNGIGIPEDKLPHIFGAFEQVDPSSTRRHQGTGLGLAISSRFCELLGGKLHVVSSLGKGSVFSFSIEELTPADLADPDPAHDDER